MNQSVLFIVLENYFVTNVRINCCFMQMSLNSTWPNKHVVDRFVVIHFSLLAIHSMYWPFVAATFHVAGYIVSKWSFIGRETPLNNCSPVTHLKDGDLPCIHFPLCTWMNNVNFWIIFVVFMMHSYIWYHFVLCVPVNRSRNWHYTHELSLIRRGCYKMVSELCVDCRIVTLEID